LRTSAYPDHNQVDGEKMSKKVEHLQISQCPILVPMLRGCELMFLCNDGKWYRNREMAKKLNMRPSALRDRFVRMHWSHPDLLVPNRYGCNKAKTNPGKTVKPKEVIGLQKSDRPMKKTEGRAVSVSNAGLSRPKSRRLLFSKPMNAKRMEGV